MPPRSRLPCTVCHHQASKYTCAACRVDYCSIACYKTHKERCAPGSEGTTTTSVPLAEAPPAPTFGPDHEINIDGAPAGQQPLQGTLPFRPLTTLEWPYVPDASAYPDPLSRDDPKPLQTHQYEAIATSPAVRALLANPRLCVLLGDIDTLRGAEREEALQRALGVDSRLLKNADGTSAGAALDEDTRAFRTLAEAVETAVRGGRENVLGLNWD